MPSLVSFGRFCALSLALVATGGIVTLPVPGTAQAAPAANTRTAKAPVAALTDADPALWVVRDADTTLYLFGTIHVLKPGLSWFDEAVREAFDASDTLVMELVQPAPDEAVALQQKYGMNPDGSALSAKLTPEQRGRYEKFMTSLGLPASAFDTFDPWMAAFMLTYVMAAKSGYNPADGNEMQLGAAARGTAKTIIGLESAEEQFQMLDDLPEATQVAFLNETVSMGKKGGEMLDSMVASWARGDAEALADLLDEGLTDPVLRRALMDDRNQRWAATLKQRMALPGTQFVAVGAGHLAGPNSVQERLGELGLIVERVAY